VVAVDTHISSNIISNLTIGFTWSDQYDLFQINETEWIYNSEHTYSKTVRSGDVDGDGTKEIITFSFAYSTPRKVILQIWNFTNNQLMLEDSFAWDYQGNDITAAQSADVGNVLGNEEPEIVTLSILKNETGGREALMDVFNVTDGKITRITSIHWYNLSRTNARDVQIGDLDKDGTNEIITG